MWVARTGHCSRDRITVSEVKGLRAYALTRSRMPPAPEIRKRRENLLDRLFAAGIESVVASRAGAPQVAATYLSTPSHSLVSLSLSVGARRPLA
jgi:hypothetical protein